MARLALFSCLVAAAVLAPLAAVQASEPLWTNFTTWSAGPNPLAYRRPSTLVCSEANSTAAAACIHEEPTPEQGGEDSELRTSRHTLGDLADCMQGRTHCTFVFEGDEQRGEITVLSHHPGVTDDDEVDDHVLDCMEQLVVFGGISAQLVSPDDPRLQAVGLPPEYRDLRTAGWFLRNTSCPERSAPLNDELQGE